MSDIPQASPVSEEVARLLCPEAFRLRDEFEQAMQRLVKETGAANEDLDRLKQEIMELARTTAMSTMKATDVVAMRYVAFGAQTG